jgi:hypothetical protein
MTQKRIGDSALAKTLSNMELEFGRLRDSLGVTSVGSLGSLASAEGINQSCNGICGGYEAVMQSVKPIS